MTRPRSRPVPRPFRRARGRRARVRAYACACGRVAIHPHPTCPACGRRPAPARLVRAAVVLADTVVRVTPDGSPHSLALVRVGRAGTLCAVRGRLRGSGHDRVLLAADADGRLTALGAGWRLDPAHRDDTVQYRNR